MDELKWTTYDGTAETLPLNSNTALLLVSDPVYGIKVCVASTFIEVAMAGLPGWAWLPIPTPARLAAREAAYREALEFYAREDHWKEKPTGSYDCIIPATIAKDAGKIARAALAKGGE